MREVHDPRGEGALLREVPGAPGLLLPRRERLIERRALRRLGQGQLKLVGAVASAGAGDLDDALAVQRAQDKFIELRVYRVEGVAPLLGAFEIESVLRRGQTNVARSEAAGHSQSASSARMAARRSCSDSSRLPPCSNCAATRATSRASLMKPSPE